MIWFVVAVAIPWTGRNGGDSAIAALLYFMIWTFPFGPIYYLSLDEAVDRAFGPAVSGIAGLVVVISIAFAFWFVLMPWIRQAAIARRSIK